MGAGSGCGTVMADIYPPNDQLTANLSSRGAQGSMNADYLEAVAAPAAGLHLLRGGREASRADRHSSFASP